VKAVIDRCNEIDILVNCAGILEYARFGDIYSGSFERQFSVNTLSVVLMMQAAVPHFPDSGGRIVNVSSNIFSSDRRLRHLLCVEGSCQHAY
jgi:3-oxoacyl-[acyl-carrier protein] reductase